MYFAWGDAPAQNFVRTGLRKKNEKKRPLPRRQHPQWQQPGQGERWVGRYLPELGMPPLTMQDEGLTKGASCPSHCPRSGAS